MRKIFALLVFPCFISSSLFAQVQKVVLVEEGTGTWCQWCPRGDIYAQELEKNFPGQYVFVAVHDGGSDPMINDEYSVGLSLPAIPSGWVDRTYVSALGPFDDLFMDMNQQLALSPPAGVEVTTTWEASTREMTMTITAEFVDDLNGDYRLAAIVVEDGVTGPAPAYDQSNSYSGGGADPMGGYENLPNPVSASIMVYNHVGRHLPGGFKGEPGSLPAIISAGDSHSYTYNYILPSEYDEEYVHVVGILINADNGQVLNAGKSNYLPGFANGKPFFHSEPQEVGFIGLNYKYDIVTHDPEHDELTISNISNLPPGLELIDIGEGFGELIGVPTEMGTFDVTLNVTDGEWDIEQDFQITIGEPTEDWIQVGGAGFNNFEPAIIDIEIGSNGVPYVMATNSDSDQAFLFNYENDNWEQIGDARSAEAFHAGMALGPNDSPYIYSDGVVSKWNGSDWDQVGGNIPGSDFIYAEIIVATDGTPFIVHFSPPSNTVAYRFNGTDWEQTSNVTDAVGVWNRFNLDNNGRPILIYGTDGSSIAYSEIVQWDGANWNKLGSDYIEPNSQTYFDHDVAVTPNGEIYAALTIGVGTQALNIYQFIGDEWELIAENLSNGATESCNLESDPDGNLIVGFRDEDNGGRTSVMKYDGNEWSYMGLAGFTAIASRHSMAVAPNGVPYVAYRDADAGEMISVKKFEDLTSVVSDTPETIENINLYPNPNNGEFTLEFTEGKYYEIISATGQIIQYGKLNHEMKRGKLHYQKIEMTGHSNGVYFIKIVSEKRVWSKKFFVK